MALSEAIADLDGGPKLSTAILRSASELKTGVLSNSICRQSQARDPVLYVEM